MKHYRLPALLLAGAMTFGLASCGSSSSSSGSASSAASGSGASIPAFISTRSGHASGAAGQKLKSVTWLVSGRPSRQPL